MRNPLSLDEQFANGRSVDREVVVRNALGLPNNASADEVTAEILRRGHDGVAFNWKRYGNSTEYMVPDPSQVRSRFAAFDPAKIGSPDLLAGIGGAGLLGYGLLGPSNAQAAQPSLLGGGY
jgi:hypothetical protein